MSTFPAAMMSPRTLPATTTVFATTAALTFPVFTHRQHVLVQIDVAFDLTFDHQILVPAQLAFEYD